VLEENSLRKPTVSRPSKGLSKDLNNTQFERVLSNASQLAICLIGAVAAVIALQAGQFILAPVFLAITVGLMFGPVADALEARGVPEPLSAGLVVIMLLVIIFGSGWLFAGPLAEWVRRGPVVWEKLQAELANWKEPLESLGAVQEQVKGVFGGDAMEVTVEDGSTVTNIAMLAPAIFAQVLIFLASLYFFLATRENIRVATLSLCVSRRMRWRTAHVFRDVEQKVSKYLITISLVNIGVGIVVTCLMAAIGMPSPILWGALAAVLNYVPFVGQGVMALILFLVGLATQTELAGALLPVGLYWAVNFVEGNFVTPNLLGRTMTINPFLIFLSLTYWLWAWGPVGGLVAVPSLLILYSVVTHILPIRQITPRKTRRKVDAKASDDVEEALKETSPVKEAETPVVAKAVAKPRRPASKATTKPAAAR
jgi:predicted PurR-regulated permease PerM